MQTVLSSFKRSTLAVFVKEAGYLLGAGCSEEGSDLSARKATSSVALVRTGCSPDLSMHVLSLAG